MTCYTVDSAGDRETNDHTLCNCGSPSKRISRKTLVSMLKPQFLDEGLKSIFRFCPAPDCPIVYFEEQGARIFTVDDLRIIVGAKASTDPIPLCYCFGFDESHLREEILQTGSTTIPESISRLIHDGLCACDVRNPSGVCCLGEVNRAAKRLKRDDAQPA